MKKILLSIAYYTLGNIMVGSGCMFWFGIFYKIADKIVGQNSNPAPIDQIPNFIYWIIVVGLFFLFAFSLEFGKKIEKIKNSL